MTVKEILGGFNTTHIWNPITKHNVYSALRGGRISKCDGCKPSLFVDTEYFGRHGLRLLPPLSKLLVEHDNLKTVRQAKSRERDELNGLIKNIIHDKELAQEKSKAEYYERLFERQFERTNQNATRYAALVEKLKKDNSNTDNLIKAFSVSFFLLTVATIIASNVSLSGSDAVLKIFGVVSLYLFGVMYGAYNLCRVLFNHE